MGPVLNRLSGTDKLMPSVTEHREATRACRTIFVQANLRR